MQLVEKVETMRMVLVAMDRVKRKEQRENYRQYGIVSTAV